MSAAMTERCDFVELRVDSAIHYHQCQRCRAVAPSFDPPERTYRDCPASGAMAAPLVLQPSTARRLLFTFFEALRRWARAGFPRSPLADRALRASACALCPLQEFVGPGKRIERCQSCGCWLPLKRRMASEACPAERWPGQRHAHGQGLVMVEGKLRAGGGCGCTGGAT